MATRRLQMQKSAREAGLLERVFRASMLLIGGTAFGLSAGSLGTHGLLTLMTGGLTPEGWGAGPAWLLIMAIGGAIGLIAGLAFAIGRIRYWEPRAYRVNDWLGVAVGIAAGVVLFQLVSDRYYWFMQALFLSAILPPCIAAGRFLLGDVVRRPIIR